MVEFRHRGEPERLMPGEIFRVSKEKNYRDTDANNVREIISEVEQGLCWKASIKKRFERNNPWLYSITTSPNRDLFFRQRPPQLGSKILDIGSGWGQIALPLAQRHEVCALEPTPERIDFIRAVAKQEGVSSSLSFINADYFAIDFQTRFDIITCIGVLEWVGVFSDGDDPQDLQLDFLKKIRHELSQDGKCIIGIENRLGLKYLLGSDDDHIAVPDIATYDAALAKELWFKKSGQQLRSFTYSYREYEHILKQAGFNQVHFFASFPDYKLPQVILPADTPEEVCQYFISGGYVTEHNGANGTPLPNQKHISSHYRSFAELQIAHYFAPSYFIEAT